MLRQIEKKNIETRLADDKLYIFKTVNNEEAAKYIARFEIYPIAKFGTPEEIMKALESESILLCEEVEDGYNKQIPRLSLL